MPKAKSTKTKTTKKNPSGKTAGKGVVRASRFSAPTSRAKAPRPATQSTSERHIGHPKDSPNIWTPEHIEEVAALMWAYIQKTDCPLECEFCFDHRIAYQRINEHQVLREMKELLFAKRQAYTIRNGINLGQGEGPRGAFLAKLAANAGAYSLVEKSEVETRNTNVTTYAIPDNGRGKKGHG